MVRINRVRIFLFLVLVVSLTSAKTPREKSLTLYKGQAVEAVEFALDNPRDPSALDSIYIYGTDSRLYVMIRGWLVQELAGVQSILGSMSVDNKHKKMLQERETFLEQAIRRIDLE